MKEEKKVGCLLWSDETAAERVAHRRIEAGTYDHQLGFELTGDRQQHPFPGEKIISIGPRGHSTLERVVPRNINVAALALTDSHVARGTMPATGVEASEIMAVHTEVNGHGVVFELMLCPIPVVDIPVHD